MRYLLLILVLLAFPATASADTLDTQLAALRPVVTTWWADQGRTATRCDSVEFSRQALSEGTWADTLEGTALADPQYHPDVRYPVCHVIFNEALTSATPAKVCTVVLHEWGHILGLNHSPDPTSIMYADLIAPPPVCAAWGAPPHKGGEDLLVPARNPTRHARWAAVRAQRRLGRDLQVAWRHGRTERQVVDR